MLNAFLVALAVFICVGGAELIGFTMLNRPIVIGPLVGLFLGDLHTGVIIGASLEAVFMGVVNIGGASAGHTTDPDGFLKALAYANIPLKDRVVILGCGGVARTMAYEVLLKGNDLEFAVRQEDTAMVEKLISEIKNTFKTAKVKYCTIPQLSGEITTLINATPIGMHNMNNDCSDYEETSFLNCLKPSCIIADMVYRTNGTKLVQDAVRLGLTAFGGERMLFHQGKLAFKLWTGLEYIPES